MVSEKAPSHHPDETEWMPIGLFLLVLFTNFYLLDEICYLNMLCLMSCCTSVGVSFILQQSTM